MDGFIAEHIHTVRVANITLATALCFAASYRIWRDWPKFSRRAKNVRIHLSAFLTIVAAGTAEQLAQNTEPGWRSYLTLLVNISLAVGLWVTRNDSLGPNGD